MSDIVLICRAVDIECKNLMSLLTSSKDQEGKLDHNPLRLLTDVGDNPRQWPQTPRTMASAKRVIQAFEPPIETPLAIIDVIEPR